MTVFFDKARERWRYDFMLGGLRYGGYAVDPNSGEPATSRRSALAAEESVRVAARVAPKVPKVADTTLGMVVADLMPKWMRLKAAENIKVYVDEILEFYGPDVPIADLTQSRVDDYVEFATVQTISIWKGGSKRKASDPANARYWHHSDKRRAPRTVNLYIERLRLILARAAILRDPLTKGPVLREVPTVTDVQEFKRKPRPVPDSVLSVLMQSLPKHCVEALTTTLYFGFRKGEIFGLTDGDIDFDAGGVWFRAEAVKDKEDEFVPGGTEAMAYMRTLVDQARARGQRHLITYRRFLKNPTRQAAEPWKPIKSPKSAWRRVMKEIEKTFGRKWCWHNIRASFITHVVVTSGAVAAQKMARHSDYKTTELYVGVADSFTRNAADKVSQRPALAIVNSR